MRKLIAGNGVYICDDCVRLCMDIVQMDEHEESVKRTKILLGDGDVPKPAEIKAFLDEYIIGQGPGQDRPLRGRV